MVNLGNMMKQAQEMQSKMQEMQEKLVSIEISSNSGGGLVSVTLNGKGEMRNLHIDPSLFKSYFLKSKVSIIIFFYSFGDNVLILFCNLNPVKVFNYMLPTLTSNFNMFRII